MPVPVGSTIGHQVNISGIMKASQTKGCSMNLKLSSFAVTTYPNDPTPVIRAKLSIVFSDPELAIGGSIDLDFKHDGARSLTFEQVEKMAIEKASAAV
jgi:hypothetical protein